MVGVELVVMLLVVAGKVTGIKSWFVVKETVWLPLNSGTVVGAELVVVIFAVAGKVARIMIWFVVEETV